MNLLYGIQDTPQIETDDYNHNKPINYGDENIFEML